MDLRVCFSRHVRCSIVAGYCITVVDLECYAGFRPGLLGRLGLSGLCFVLISFDA